MSDRHGETLAEYFERMDDEYVERLEARIEELTAERDAWKREALAAVLVVDELSAEVCMAGCADTPVVFPPASQPVSPDTATEEET